MSLRDEVVQAFRTQGPKCRVPDVFAALPKGDAADLADLLADPTVPTTAVQRALAKRGHNIPIGSWRSHVNGECSCATVAKLRAKASR